jgi:hypothetical protein
MGRTALGLLLLAGLFLTASSLLSQPAQAQTGPSVRFSPATSRVDYDDGGFSIRVELSGLDHHGSVRYDHGDKPPTFASSEGLGAFELYFYYDPQVVRVTGWEERGAFLSSRRPTCMDRETEPGLYVMACVTQGGSAGPNGSGRLGTIKLEPVANGSTEIELETELAGPLGDGLPTILSSGRVEVRDAPTDADPPDPKRPRPGDGPNRNNNPDPHNLGGGGTNTTNSNGSNDPSSNVEGSTVGPNGANGAGSNADGTGGPAGAEALGANGTGYSAPNPLWRNIALAIASAAVGLALIVFGMALKPGWRRVQ